MSGFAGVIDSEGRSADEQLLQRMTESLAFRGPDGTQIRTLPNAGFCFTFLRTGPAPQTASQPCTVDGKTWLIGDVRLDGRAELQELLKRKDIRIPAAVSDEELILHAWQVWGEEGFQRLQGDFAFAIWDSVGKRVFCLRDLIGARPFFYAQSGSRLYFSNTLETLRLPENISSNLDRKFIGDFLLQGWCADSERTVFRDIRRLRPGHLLEFSDGEVKLRRFTSLPIEEPLFLKEPEEYVEQFQALLRQAVLERLPVDKAAIYLSGGLDSTSVAAQAMQLSRETRSTQLHAFTLDFRPLFEDEEGKYASLAAEYLGIPIEIFYKGSAVPFASLRDPNIRMPEPNCEPFLVSNAEFCRRVSSHARVGLSGDGGDDILTGQARSYFVYLLRKWRFGTIVKSIGGYVLKRRRLPLLRMGIRARLRRLWGHKEVEIIYPQWIEPHFEEELHLRERWQELQQPPMRNHPLHPEAYTSLTGTFWASVLEEEDPGWTGVPVELRSPFLDLRLVRFLLRVPSVPWCMQKELLRTATKGILPEEIRLRPKAPLWQDPLPLLMEKGCWSLPSFNQPERASREFVNWQRVAATSPDDAGYVILEKLRPVFLEHWLKGVENRKRIQ